MGILDRFRRAKQTSAPPVATTLGPPPEVPCKATIATFTIADAVGMLELAGGNRLRFGRSACKGFEPVVGAAVIVDEVAADARGYKARSVKLDPNDTGYDALLSARDAEHGLPSRTQEAGEAAATARQLGVITLLLRDPLPSGHVALRNWATACGFPRDGFDVRIERDLELVIAGQTMLTYPGREPFPTDDLDMRNAGSDFDVGRSFIGLGMGLPGAERTNRAVLGDSRDSWAPNGRFRQLSRLVCVLADLATAVVLHRAGDLVVPIDDFVRMLGDLEDAECRPFAAWLDIAISRGPVSHYATFGMDIFGLPDVLAPVDPEDRWSRSRRHEAVLYACYRMIRDNRALTAGDTLAVPVRLSIGAWPLERDDGGAETTYTIRELDGNLELVPLAEPALTGDVAPNVYQALFDRALSDLVPSTIVRDVRARSQQPLPHTVEVRARDDGRGYWIITNGFGRQSGFEVAAWTSRESFDLLQLVGMLAASALESQTPWKPGDTVAAPVEDLGIGGFVVADGGSVEVGDRPGVSILLVIPLAETDYQRVRGGGAATWLAENPVDDTSWDPFLTGLE